MTELTVAIPSYDGRELLARMLGSLARQTFGSFEIVVVDDCSADGTVEWLAAEWPAVRVVALRERSGVTKAMNACLAAADTELVGVFNNDMELEPECLERLVAALREHPEAGSATPKMLDFSDHGILDGAGDLLSWRGGGTRRGHGTPDDGRFDAPGEVFGACGGAAIYRRAALEAVGRFDERYFAYYEDLDWALRAQLAGWRCRYVPDAVLYHRGSATLGRGMTPSNAYLLWRNPVWLIAKCYPGWALVRHLPSIVRGQAGNLWTAARKRLLPVWLRAMRDALRGLPSAVRARRSVARRVGRRELEAVVRG